MDDPAVRCHFDRMSGTSFNTSPAADAFCIPGDDFGVGVKGFRVAAPWASQGATFEKYGCPDPRPIVDGKTLDIKDQARALVVGSFHQGFHFKVRVLFGQ